MEAELACEGAIAFELSIAVAAGVVISSLPSQVKWMLLLLGWPSISPWSAPKLRAAREERLQKQGAK
jgi:hypothetical protein